MTGRNRSEYALAEGALFCNNAAMSAMQKALTPAKAAAIFISFTAYFCILLFTLLPFLKANFDLNPALYWFITGCFLFVPLLMFAVWRAWAEGNRGLRDILKALHVKPFTSLDWKYAILGLILVLVLTGGIFGASWLLHRVLGWKMLSTTPWFMTMRPFAGPERLLLLAWLPMFFFNIVGEELLWRGYVQSRLPGKPAWLLCSFLWLLFYDRDIHPRPVQRAGIHRHRLGALGLPASCIRAADDCVMRKNVP